VGATVRTTELQPDPWQIRHGPVPRRPARTRRRDRPIPRVLLAACLWHLQAASNNTREAENSLAAVLEADELTEPLTTHLLLLAICCHQDVLT
jgi:hypothetical protein